MSLHADRPGKFLFGCLIVVLCGIIGAGQLLGTRTDQSTDRSVEHSAIQQTAYSAPSPLPFNWTLHEGPTALYFFMSAVVVWVVSMVSRQIVMVSSDGIGDGASAPHGGNSALWSAFDFGVSLVILVSAS